MMQEIQNHLELLINDIFTSFNWPDDIDDSPSSSTFSFVNFSKTNMV